MILEWKILHQVDSLICTPKKQQTSSITFKSNNGSWSEWIRSGKQIRPNFLRSTSSLQNLANKSGAFKPTLYTFYTSHLRWNSTMRRCIYQTKLGQNAVFHNFSRQIALIQYSGRSIVGFQRNCSKNFQNHLYGQPVLTFDKRQICNVSFSGFITMCNLKKHLIREAFWVNKRNSD